MLHEEDISFIVTSIEDGRIEGKIQIEFTDVSTWMSQFADVNTKKNYRTFNLEDVNSEMTINDIKEINTNMYGIANVVVGKHDASRRVVYSIRKWFIRTNGD